MARDPNGSAGGGASNSSQREEATLKVPSKDAKKKDEKKEEDLVCFIQFFASYSLGCKESQLKVDGCWLCCKMFLVCFEIIC